MAFEVGDTAPERTVTITRLDIVRYAGASGDFNLPHVDEEFATEAGYDSVIAMGMLTGGIAGGVVHDWFGVDALRSFDIRFEDVVYPGDEITVIGTIVDRDEDAVEATVEATDASGRRVLSGSVTAADR